MGFRKHQDGTAIRAPPRKSGRAATAWAAVESGVSQMKLAVGSFRRLVNSLGTSADSPNLRSKLQKARDHILLLVKETSASLEGANDLDHLSRVNANMKAFGNLAKEYAQVLDEYQNLQESSVQKEGTIEPVSTRVTVPHGTSSQPYDGNPPATHCLRPSTSTSSSARHSSSSHEMLTKTPPNLKKILEQKQNIRNVCLIDDTEEGSSIIEDLVAVAAAQDSVLEVQLSTAESHFRAKSSDIHVYCGLDSELVKGKKGGVLMNMFDSRITCDAEPLYICDGVLTIIDSCGSVSPRTSVLLQQAVLEGLRPVLAVDNLDSLSAITDGEVAYSTLFNLISEVNVIVERIPGDFQFHPENGSVAFANGSDWAFTLANFAEYFASDLGISEAQLMKLLWGDHFYDPQTKEWTTIATGSPTCKRGFAQFCYDPIKKVLECCRTGKRRELRTLLNKYNVSSIVGEKKLHRKALRKSVMQSWLPARKCILQMIVHHVPSPAHLQSDRLENLYGGSPDDQYAAAIRGCNSDGSLMVYVSSMINASGEGRCIALARVYSGTISAGSKVRIIGPNYPHSKTDCYVTEVNKTAVLMGGRMICVESVPSGNMVALYMKESFSCMHATITEEDAVDAYPIGATKDKDYRLMPQGSVSQIFKLPREIYKDLYHHQDGALRWFWKMHCEGKGGVLADDMGMGKTRQICAFIRGLFSSDLIKSVMIVIPRTVIQQWIGELGKLGLKDIVTQFLSPSIKKQRASLDEAIKVGGVLVTTYGVFLNHQKRIMGSGTNSPWDYIFLDEGHKIKNPWTKISGALNNASCAHKFVVTGTPYQNHTKEFFAIVNFACPGLLGDKTYFDQVFGLPIDKGKHKDAKPDQIERAMGAFKKLHGVMGFQMLRRTKKLLQAQGVLKKKQEFTVWLKLAPHQAHQYRSLLNVRRDSTCESFAAISVAANICNHPLILKKNCSSGPAAKYTNQVLKSDTFNGNIIESSCKVLFTLDLVARLLGENHKILIFSQSRPMLKLIKAALSTQMDESQIFLMDGTTKLKERDRLVKKFSVINKEAETSEDEDHDECSIDGGEYSGDEDDDEYSGDKDNDEYSGDEDDDEFSEEEASLSEEEASLSEDDESQEDEEVEPLVFLMSTLVGGLGLNLVSASRAIIVDPAKNPSTDNQTVDRIFRLGQEKDAIIYRLVTCDTVEEHTYRNQVIKGEIANSITEGRQCRRGIRMKTTRVLTLPRSAFLRSLTHRELLETYKNNFDECMTQEVRLVQESPMVSCITNHSRLFSLEEDRYQAHEVVDEDWPEVKKEVSQGLYTEPSSTASRGHTDGVDTYDSRWRDRRGSSAKHKGKSVH